MGRLPVAGIVIAFIACGEGEIPPAQSARLKAEALVGALGLFTSEETLEPLCLWEASSWGEGVDVLAMPGESVPASHGLIEMLASKGVPTTSGCGAEGINVFVGPPVEGSREKFEVPIFWKPESGGATARCTVNGRGHEQPVCQVEIEI